MDMIKCKGCNKTINRNSVFCPKCGETNIKETSFFIKFVYIFFITTILYYLGVFTPQTLKEKLKSSITIEQKDYYKSGLENYYTMSFIIQNKSDYDIENIKLRCNHYASDGVKIGRNHKKVEYKISHHNKKIFNSLAMGYMNAQTVAVKCEILDFTIIDN